MLEASKTADKAPSARAAHEIFDAIANHISRYLACDPHQLTVLTLWAAHTWCYESFPTAVYLNICSPEPQSGKTVCLNLLRQLARNPSFFTGSSPRSIMQYLLIESNRVVKDHTDFDLTLFFDDCHHTFAPTERQPLLALLNSGVDSGICYFAAPHAYSFFAPKAFAGNAPLPPSLAQRCIPITLRRKKRSDVLNRFHSDRDQAAAAFKDELSLWTSRNSQALIQAAEKAPPRLPEGLTPREQACAEPLIHMADRVGGSWPDRARTAVREIFRVAEGSHGVELLCNLRSLFLSKQDPEHISTKDILAALATLEHRPWGGWSCRSGHKLGALLRPYGVRSSPVHVGSNSFRGYRFKDFQDAWDRYVPPVPGSSTTQSATATTSAT
jgi:hypothetical protein